MQTRPNKRLGGDGGTDRIPAIGLYTDSDVSQSYQSSSLTFVHELDVVDVFPGASAIAVSWVKIVLNGRSSSAERPGKRLLSYVPSSYSYDLIITGDKRLIPAALTTATSGSDSFSSNVSLL